MFFHEDKSNVLVYPLRSPNGSGKFQLRVELTITTLRFSTAIYSRSCLQLSWRIWGFFITREAGIRSIVSVFSLPLSHLTRKHLGLCSRDHFGTLPHMNTVPSCFGGSMLPADDAPERSGFHTCQLRESWHDSRLCPEPIKPFASRSRLDLQHRYRRTLDHDPGEASIKVEKNQARSAARTSILVVFPYTTSRRS
jgi:hypothetical protein